MDSLNDLAPWIVLGAAALTLTVALARLASPRPQFVKKRFLTDAEARVLALLEASLPSHRIMAQVAMGALLRAGEADRRRAQTTRNPFAQKIVDFVVVTRDTAEVVAIVELDDRTHSAAKDKTRDAMTLAAGYRTFRIPSRPQPTAASVSAATAELLDPSMSRRAQQR